MYIISYKIIGMFYKELQIYHYSTRSWIMFTNLIVKPRISVISGFTSLGKKRSTFESLPSLSRRDFRDARRALCVRRIYKNRTHVRAHSGTHYARVHARFDEETRRARSVLSPCLTNRRIHLPAGESTRICARKVRARVRRCSLARSPSDRVITRALVLLDAWSDSQTSPSLFYSLLYPHPRFCPSLLLFPSLRFSSFSQEREREERRWWRCVCVCVWEHVYQQIARARERERENGLLTRCPFSIKCNDSSSRWKSVSSPEGYNLRSTKIVSRLREFYVREFEDSISNISPVRAFLSSILDFPRDLLLTVVGWILADFYLLLRRLPAILPLLTLY